MEAARAKRGSRIPTSNSKEKLHINIPDNHSPSRRQEKHSPQDHLTRIAESKNERPPSALSDITVVNETCWTPPTEVLCHPSASPHSTHEVHSPMWVPDPESHAERHTRPRTLVLCFDGTGDQFDESVSIRRLPLGPIFAEADQTIL